MSSLSIVIVIIDVCIDVVIVVDGGDGGEDSPG